ncbi:hypothetical protein [Streptomyces sp. NBC_00091]|uniref:hypothetical protein n=1 Tax=Streptomyces sp. NBC_00091 TaxID=2975648 RepID=UPI00224E8665|nr:hypothetical protein [Streptomyces sp. NBC_00091]MCX5381583.1 hypothetical protein [Streptomyces sp. NBC_00091]
MHLPQPHIPRSHRARRRSRHAAAAPAAAPAAGRRAVRRPSLLPSPGRLRPSALCAAGAALVSLLVAARAGALTRVWEFLDFGAGVLSLVCLTSTVLWGLVATDRVLLGSGHRLLAQGVHRGLAVAGLGFLALHIWVKVAGQQASAAAAVLPFADAERPVAIGLGTLAGYLFVAVAASGALRSVFATKSRSLWWRALHIGAYPAWGASLLHGLKAGRAADTWVTAAYGLCLAGVIALLAFRLRARGLGSAWRPSAPQSAAEEPAAGPARARPFFVQDVPLADLLVRPRPRTAKGAAGPSAGPLRPDRAPYAAAATAGPGADRQSEQLPDRERWL